ncbi:hypothetical protein HNQ91_005745 [Filimonas zeae]|uniref:Uncharacterized protein n=1 Tax=Filimonas zeae TaxID=1737353 RepID=A0A917N0Y4_9BACT|nr:hypothetical protein [Filimonas zeae]GGH82201.1 hypothetical protein GCM10011379_55730 [Filimonas zeae]
MKKANTHKDKLSKGERLHWKPLKEGITIRVSRDAVYGRFVSEHEIRNRQQGSGNSNNLLVP